MARTGRPKKQIDQRTFEKLCGLQCTLNELCAFFECQDDTLNKWCKRTYGKTFSDVFAEKREIGKISLRRIQFQHAEKNAAMAMFLGKQYLDQKDSFENKEIKLDIEDLSPLADLLRVKKNDE